MKIEQATENTWKFWCPGCDSAHMVSDSWQVDAETATITPSVLVYSHKTLIDSDLPGDALTAPENVTTTPQCHSFVTNGQIQFLADSTHHLSGQTVDLPEWIYPTDEIPGPVMGDHDKPKVRTTSVRLPEDLAADAELVARIDRVPMSALIGDAIDAHIRKRRADPEFRARLQERIDADQRILDRLANPT